MPNSNPVSILQLSDTHIMSSPDDTLLGVNTAYYFKAVLAEAIASGRRFDLCLVTGDIAQDPVAESYDYVLTQLRQLDIPCICLPGNHDDLEIMRRVLCTDTIDCRKRYMLSNWQIVCLNSQLANSARGYLSLEELQFLEDCLETSRNLNTLIAVHHHSIPSESSWMDTMIIENALEFLDIINRHPNARGIVNGHIHQVMDMTLSSCRILTAPSTCFQFKPGSDHFSLDNSAPGFRWIDLYDDGKIASGVVRIPEKIAGLRTDSDGY